MKSIDECIHGMLENGFYRFKTPGGTLFMSNDGETRYNPATFAKGHELILGYKKSGSPDYLDLATIPWSRQDFPVIEKTVYDINRPFGKVEGKPIFNTAKELEVEFPVKAAKNKLDTSIFWNHLEYLCGDVSQDIKEWVKDWLCDIFQNPNDKKGTALIFIGGQGCGKSIFFDKLMSALLGEYYHYNNGKDYSEKFNLGLKDKLLLNFDEGFATKSKAAEAKLKSFITQPVLKIEGKGSNPITVLNPARAVFTTNDGWAVKMDDDDRRFAVFTTVREDFATQGYFDRLVDAIDNRDLLEKFMHELQNRKITSRLNKPPMTEAKQTQKVFSAGKVSEWFDFIMETKSSYVVRLDDDHPSAYDHQYRLWDLYEENERIIHKKRALASFLKFKGNNEHIDSTNKLFNALRNYLATNSEWVLDNEVRRLQTPGRFTWGEDAQPQRVWVLKKK